MIRYLVQCDDLKKYIKKLLKKLEVKLKDIEIVTGSLVEANLRGIDSHGVARLPMFYINRIKQGYIAKTSQYKIVKEFGSMSIIDANYGFGQVAAFKGIRHAVKIAKKNGLGLVGIKNSSHFGIASYFSMEAIKDDMIGFALSNAGPDVAPYGAIKSYIGTNPFSIAFPSGEKYPVVLDMATSVIARGKILLNSKKIIEQGIALDKNGNPTTDASKIGTLLPFGGPKGSGIGIVIDILCSILMSSPFGPHVKDNEKYSTDEVLSHLVGAINISHFTDLNNFKKNIDQMISEIKCLPTSKGVEEVFLPGEIEARTKEERIINGIPIENDLFNILQGLESCRIDKYEKLL